MNFYIWKLGMLQDMLFRSFFDLGTGWIIADM
jgi:hypothetical protein